MPLSMDGSFARMRRRRSGADLQLEGVSPDRSLNPSSIIEASASPSYSIPYRLLLFVDDEPCIRAITRTMAGYVGLDV